MIKKTILNSSIMICGLYAAAQTTSYTLIQSNPDDCKKSIVYLDVFTADTYLNPNLGSAVKVETLIGNRLLPWLQMKYSWADASTKHVVTGFPEPKGGLKKQLIFDAGGAFFLTSKNKKKKVKVTLSSISSGNRTYSRYMMIPSMVKRMFGVDGGLYYDRRALEFDVKSHDLYHYKSADGSYDKPIGNSGSSTIFQPAGEAYKPLSMTHILSLYGGLHYRKMINTEIVVGSYGSRTNASVVDLYADLMLAPFVPIANVVDITGNEWQITPQSGAISHLGWRAGVTCHSAKSFGFEYSLELGKKPGPSLGNDFLTNGSYISMGMGISLGFNKQIHMKEKTEKKE